MHDSNPVRGDSVSGRRARLDDSPIERPIPKSFSSGLSSPAQYFCAVCQEMVRFATLVEAADEYNTDLQDIKFLLAKEDIHTVPRDPAVISICCNSLEFCFESRQTRLLDSHFELSIQRLSKFTER